MTKKSGLQRISMLAALCIGLALLASCGGPVRPSSQAVEAFGPFDLVLQTFNHGQFKVGDGGVVSGAGLSSHFAYLQSQDEIPGKVLLERSEESRIRGPQLDTFTRLQAQYGFQAFVQHKGEIEPLHPDD